MLYLHEVHRVAGRHAAEFEDLYRAEVLPAVAQQPGARVLWYLNQAAGSGPSYVVVTLIALEGGSTWEAYAARTTAGDLVELVQQLDAWRESVTGKLLQPVGWSPMQNVVLEDVPADGREHGNALYMEDTGWPYAPLDDYIDYWDASYYQVLRALPPDRKLLEVRACFQTALGSQRRPEAILMQEVLDYGALRRLLMTTERYDPSTWPGSYMRGALAFRDQWESRLLRTSSWSPLS